MKELIIMYAIGALFVLAYHCICLYIDWQKPYKKTSITVRDILKIFVRILLNPLVIAVFVALLVVSAQDAIAECEFWDKEIIKKR